jgi:pimeloyl-ACP methyl ester carboxylesterase
MRELTCQFGANQQLVGIVTEPETSNREIAFVLVSAGLIPKFGPFRLYARLARDAAKAGFLAMRFDLGGIGDSRQDLRGVPLKQRTSLDIAAALDYLTARYGVKRVVLCGLCSGAEDSFRYAELDPRVEGLAAIDPFAYRASGWAWRNFVYRLMRRSLRGLGIYAPLRKQTLSSAATGFQGESLITYNYMEFAEADRILAALLQRRVRLYFIYTGGMRESFNHAGQLRKMFKGRNFNGLVEVDYLPRMGHTQELEEDRQIVAGRIGRWTSAYRRIPDHDTLIA